MGLVGTEQAGACGWALNEGFKSGTISPGEGRRLVAVVLGCEEDPLPPLRRRHLPKGEVTDRKHFAA